MRNLIREVPPDIRENRRKKGEIILNGNRYSPLYFENTMRYEPIGKGGVNVVLTGHDIQPLIDKLRRYTF